MVRVPISVTQQNVLDDGIQGVMELRRANWKERGGGGGGGGESKSEEVGGDCWVYDEAHQCLTGSIVNST